MEERRDLQSDLDVVRKAKEFDGVTGWGSEEFVRLAPYFSSFHKNDIAIAEHALKRAIKAEALNRELVEALDKVVHMNDYTTDSKEGWLLFIDARAVLEKVKAVMESEADD